MEENRERELIEIEKHLQYQFHDRELLNTALTHTSFVKGDGKKATHNERLEYLGDAVLELCVSDYLFRNYAKLNEGRMTRARAMTVCEEALYDAAVKIGLSTAIRLGHGEANSGGREKPSIVSDALEAVIGAIYIDGGLEKAREFVLSFAQAPMAAAVSGRQKDWKTLLQEYVQQKHLGAVQYKLISAVGPDHKKEFHMQVLLNGDPIGTGVGGSKQEAGQHAAQAGLMRLGAM